MINNINLTDLKKIRNFLEISDNTHNKIVKMFELSDKQISKNNFKEIKWIKIKYSGILNGLKY